MSDGRPYPWLSQQQEGSWTEARYLIYQPFGGLCNQLACLECAVALARATGRTLVLPRWRAQYGQPWLSEGSDYFDLSPLSRIVRCATLDQFAAARAGSGDGEGVALVRLHLCFNPAWADARGWELFPELRSLLANLEYLREVDAAAGLRLGIAAGSAAERRRCRSRVAEGGRERFSESRQRRREEEMPARESQSVGERGSLRE